MNKIRYRDDKGRFISEQRWKELQVKDIALLFERKKLEAYSILKEQKTKLEEKAKSRQVNTFKDLEKKLGGWRFESVGLFLWYELIWAEMENVLRISTEERVDGMQKLKRAVLHLKEEYNEEMNKKFTKDERYKIGVAVVDIHDLIDPQLLGFEIRRLFINAYEGRDFENLICSALRCRYYFEFIGGYLKDLEERLGELVDDEIERRNIIKFASPPRSIEVLKECSEAYAGADYDKVDFKKVYKSWVYRLEMILLHYDYKVFDLIK